MVNIVTYSLYAVINVSEVNVSQAMYLLQRKETFE